MTTAQRQVPPTTTSDRANAQAPRATTRFLTEALRAPHQIGAIAQSGPRLAAQAAGLLVPDGDPQTVVELGPGAGAITDVLHARMPAGSTLTSIEINTTMVAHLRETRPWLNVVHGDAIDLPALLRTAGLPPPDLIISALPWSIISTATQPRILAAITDAMHPNGTFATVATLPVRMLPSARRFRRHLHRSFGSVSQTRTVWRNVPPAHLYVCRSPSTRTALRAPTKR
ncbi:rRNA adenine N-6-methyltransferase family protein [Actinoplanes sp. NPDC049118]|uniref:class I SAM-dependent methyltransferase n=1 Tax=Actinoplanes sp. NPDC049118 TaxID=3155769 RepID=UPI0033EEB85A